MNNFIITLLIIICKIFLNCGLKNGFHVKLENATVAYANNDLIDFNSGVVPINATLNYLNQTIKFKFQVIDNILCDVSAARITKSNKSFSLGRFIVNWKHSISMQKFGADSIWREYTTPPLIWPPLPNVAYHTFGWAPDGSKFPPNLPSGEIKVTVSLKLKNGTRLSILDWILGVHYLTR